MKSLKKQSVIITGLVIGVLSIVLVAFGNPANMGVCVACFIRDTAGALGLDSALKLQYIRPEIIGFILGAFILSVGRKEFKPSGGSSPLLRFVISFFVMIGALVFLGCPLRMILRLAGGDFNAIIGLLGFVVGIFVGTLFLKKGFTLGKATLQPKVNGFIMPAIAAGLLAFLLIKPAFIHFSVEGPGSQHAPIAIALGVGLIVGALSQWSRMCMAGGIRDVFLIKNPHMMIGYIAVFIAALIGNIATKKFNPGFVGQPIAHTEFLWNFLGMGLVGLGSVMVGGCPLRQVIMAGEGNTDAAICFVGLLLGGATAHNFGLAASGDGVPVNGKIALLIGYAVLIVIAVFTIKKREVKIS